MEGVIEIRWLPNSQSVPPGWKEVKGGKDTHHAHYARMIYRPAQEPEPVLPPCDV